MRFTKTDGTRTRTEVYLFGTLGVDGKADRVWEIRGSCPAIKPRKTCGWHACAEGRHVHPWSNRPVSERRNPPKRPKPLPGLQSWQDVRGGTDGGILMPADQ